MNSVPRRARRRRARRALAGVCLGAAIAGVASAGGVSIGTGAPGFALPDSSGQVVSLESFRGRVVLLNFWASWCGPCRAELPALAGLSTEWPDSLFAVVAINVDKEMTAAKRYLEDLERHPDLVLFDSGWKTVKRYAPEALPGTYLIDRDGSVRYTHIGYDDRTLEEYRHVVDEVLGGTSTPDTEASDAVQFE